MLKFINIAVPYKLKKKGFSMSCMDYKVLNCFAIDVVLFSSDKFRGRWKTCMASRKRQEIATSQFQEMLN